MLGKLDVAAEGIVDAEGLPDPCCRWTNVFDLTAEDDVFDALLDIVIELVTIMAEELDAVILIGIVRGGKDDARIGAERACDVGNSWSRQWPDDEDVHSE